MTRTFSGVCLRAGHASGSCARVEELRGPMRCARSVVLVIGLTIGPSSLLPATAQTSFAPAPGSGAALPDSSPLTATPLRERVEQWWTARKNGDHRKMYELYSPQLREQRPYESFVPESVTRARIPLGGFDVVTFEAAGPDRVLAKLKLHLVVPAGTVTTDVEEDWVLSDGQWFKVYKPPVIPSPPPGMQGKIVIPGSAREQPAPPK